MADTKLCIRVDEETWRAFRIQCLERGTSASAEVEKLIQAQLRKWARSKGK